MEGFAIPALIGMGLTGAALAAMRVTGLHAERGAQAAALIAIALFYIVFAVEHGGAADIAVQSLLALVFVALALWGFQRSLWWVVVGLGAHGIYDVAFHGHAANPAPDWWGPFCLGVDLVLAATLAVWIRRGEVRA